MLLFFFATTSSASRCCVFDPTAETEQVSLAHLQLAHSMREEARKLEEFRVGQKEKRKKVSAAAAAGGGGSAPCWAKQV